MKRSRYPCVCVIALLAVLTLVPRSDANAYGYGHGYGYYRHSYGYYGHSYGHGYSYSYGHSYNPVYSYDYGHNYNGYYYNPVYGLLALPGRVIGGLLGYPTDDSGDAYTSRQNLVINESTRNTYSSATPATANTAYGNGAMDMNGRGWSLLANGYDTSALSYFATAAESHPQSGIPKVGYALSAAGSGNLSRGVWAMRRAARIDPDGMRYVHLGTEHTTRVRHLIEQYQSRVEGYQHSDDAFMVAALKYLLGDLRGAHASLTLASQYGDNAPSTRSLAQLIKSTPTSGSGYDRSEYKTPR